MSCNNDWKIIQNLNSEVIRKVLIEKDQRQTEEWLNKIANENKNNDMFSNDGDWYRYVEGPFLYIKCSDADYVDEIETLIDKVKRYIQELIASFDLEEQILKIREIRIKIIKDVKQQKAKKSKYSQPPYRERLHPKDVVAFHRCRIRNRPNSGHGFKK